MNGESGIPTHHATTVYENISKATIIEPRRELEGASAECCIASGYVLVRSKGYDRAFVTHISNVTFEFGG